MKSVALALCMSALVHATRCVCQDAIAPSMEDAVPATNPLPEHPQPGPPAAPASQEVFSARTTESHRGFPPSFHRTPSEKNSTPWPDRDVAPWADLPPGYLYFSGACMEGPEVSIAAVGDILLHPELQQQAFQDSRRYLSLWPGLLQFLRRTDLTYANLEGPMAPGIDGLGQEVQDPGLRMDGRVYSGYMRFNYHPQLASDLVRSGIDVVSTANNHALDRFALGVERTLQALQQAGLAHTGTRPRGSTESWHTITVAQGVRVAWLGCTLHTNYQVDIHHQVLRCFDDADRVVDIITRLARDPSIDAILVTPHWGDEYAVHPTEAQRDLAHQLLDAGALAVLGTHPHVLQPWEKYLTRDGRETLVVYSLGNFVSRMRTQIRRTSVVLHLGLGRASDGAVRLRGVSYLPIEVRRRGSRYRVEPMRPFQSPGSAWKAVAEALGRWNWIGPDDTLDLHPHCDAAWVPVPLPGT